MTPEEQVELASEYDWKKAILVICKVVKKKDSGSYWLLDRKRYALLSEPIAPEAQLILASPRKDYRIGAVLATTQDLTVEAQLELTQSHNWYNRRYLARNPSLFPAVQSALAKDAEDEVVVALAKRNDLIPQVQLILAQHSSRKVRLRLAMTAQTNRSPEAVALLACDPDPGVRYEAVKLNTVDLFSPMGLKLAADRAPRVREIAKESARLTRQQGVLLSDLPQPPAPPIELEEEGLSL